MLSAGAATALALVTVLAAGANSEEALLPIAVGWWIVATLIGLRLGRRAETNPPIARLLSGARASTALPENHPSAILVNRLWPLLLFTLIAGGLAFLAPQIPGIAAGFAIIWALAWRRQDAAVAAIEERDGAFFYVRAHLAGAADGARAHARLQGAAPGTHERRRHLRCAGRTRRTCCSYRSARPAGLRRADDELHDSLERAGARVAIARPHPQEPLPTMMLTDLVWARAARDAAASIIDQQELTPARSIIYSTTTAALLVAAPRRDPLRRNGRR